MWRSCANRARGLSLVSTRRELSSLSTLVHSEHLLSTAECKEEVSLRSKALIRSFSTSQGQRRNPRSSTSSRRTHRENQRPDRRRPENRGQSRQSPVNKSPRPTVTLDEASRHVAFLGGRLSELGSLPAVWSTESAQVDSADERQAIFEETQMILKRIENAVSSHQLNPSGKHGRELSYLIGQILEIYSSVAVPFGDDTSVFDACCGAMTLLQEWNLDLQPQNYACAVEVAARESRWNEASILFSEQIDPDAHGHTPMKISRHLAVGLYAIARNSQREGGATVDHVMDAVLKMCMVCPTDQDHCE